MISLEECEKLYNSFNMFKKVSNDELILYSYNYVNPKAYELFPNSKELRGIIFDKLTGELVALPFPKFFNFGEPMCPVKPSEMCVTNLKIDGSLLISFVHNGHIKLASKGSLDSWVTQRASKILSEKYKKLIDDLYNEGYTVMFEYIDKEIHTILRPKENKLVLIGARDIYDGSLLPPEEIQFIGEKYGVEYTPIYHKNIQVSEVVKEIKNKPEIEGVVGYTKTDIFKVKTEWYIKIHRIASDLREDKIKAMFVHNQLDDIYSVLPPSIKDEVVSIVRKIEKRISKKIKSVENVFKENKFKNRKELWRWLEKNIRNKKEHFIYYKVYDGSPVRDAVYEYFKRQWRC